jgi:hypothetical protein
MGGRSTDHTECGNGGVYHAEFSSVLHLIGGETRIPTRRNDSMTLSSRKEWKLVKLPVDSHGTDVRPLRCIVTFITQYITRITLITQP